MTLSERLEQYPGTLRDLAEKSGVSAATIHNIKHGLNENPTVNTVQKLERALDEFQSAQPTPEASADKDGATPAEALAKAGAEITDAEIEMVEAFDKAAAMPQITN